jgi:hypothetical protein
MLAYMVQHALHDIAGHLCTLCNMKQLQFPSVFSESMTSGRSRVIVSLLDGVVVANESFTQTVSGTWLSIDITQVAEPCALASSLLLTANNTQI